MDSIITDLTPLKYGEVDLGTSIMAIRYRDGVILGADSRTTTGAMIVNRVTDKLTQLQGKIWCCRSGSAADTQALADIVSYYLGHVTAEFPAPPTTHTAATLLRELAYSNKESLTAGLIVAGYDEDNGGEIYSIPLGGSLHKRDYAIAGSGSTYIYGLCNKTWKPDMTKEEAVEFVKSSLTQAIRWDGSSGGVIRMVCLSSGEPERLTFFPDEYQDNSRT